MKNHKVEPVSELKKIIDNPQIHSHAPLYSRLVTRKISVYVTWLLLHTNITANQVTLLQNLFGFIGFFFICCPKIGIAFLGILMIQFGYVLDCVDGEVARYRKSPSVNGIYIDFFNHVTVIPLIIVGMGFHYYSISGNHTIYAILGVLGGLFSISPRNLASNETILYLLEMTRVACYDYNKLKKGSGNQAAEEAKGSASRKFVVKSVQWFTKNWNHLAHYPGSMNIVTLFIFGEILWGKRALELCFPAFAIYVLLTIAHEFFLFYRSVRNHAVETRCDKIHREHLSNGNNY